MRMVLANTGRGWHTFGLQAVALTNTSCTDFSRAPDILLRTARISFLASRSHAVRRSRKHNEDSK